MKKYKVRQGRRFNGVTQRAKAGEFVYFPDNEDVSGFFDIIEPAGEATAQEIKKLNLTPPTVDGVEELAKKAKADAKAEADAKAKAENVKSK